MRLVSLAYGRWGEGFAARFGGEFFDPKPIVQIRIGMMT
jgi:hypothetical protein